MNLATPPPASDDRTRSLVRAGLALGTVAAAVVLLLLLLDVVLLAFGAVLVAVLLHAVAAPMESRLGFGRNLALTIAVALLTSVTGLLTWAFGHQAGAQLAILVDLLPRTWDQVHSKLSSHPLGAMVLEQLDPWTYASAWLFGQGPQLAANAVTTLAGAVIVLFAGLYLAYHPETYLRGALSLAPRRLQPRIAEAFAALLLALKQWLVGQLFSMALMGVTVTVGLLMAGTPAPLALGIIAAVGQLVPVVGPFLAAIPGLLASAPDPSTLLWATIVYLGAAQLESKLFTPLVLRKLVQLPMAVTLFAVLATGALMGPLGVLFATPLAVVAFVLVKMFWIDRHDPAEDAPSPGS